MALLFLSAPFVWYLSRDSFPRLSKLCGFISLFFVFILFLNLINSI